MPVDSQEKQMNTSSRGYSIFVQWNGHKQNHNPNAPKCTDYLTYYMNGLKWPHEQGENGLVNIPYMEHLAEAMIPSIAVSGSLNRW